MALFAEVQMSLFVAGAVSSSVTFRGRIGLGSWSDRSRNGLGMVSERSRIGRALEMTFQLFSRNLCEILESPFAWQAQYLVSLGNDTCYSAHCK